MYTRTGGLYRISYPKSLRFGSGYSCDTLRAHTTRERECLIPRGTVILMTGYRQFGDQDHEAHFYFLFGDELLFARDSCYFDFEELTEEESASST
jgi:hypothetical protein